MKKLLIATAAAAFAISGAANAATLWLTDAPGSTLTSGTIPGGSQLHSPNNDVLDALYGPGASLGGWFGAQVNTSAGLEFRVDYFGHEAFFDNTVTIEGAVLGDLPEAADDGVEIETTTLAAPLASAFVTASGSILDFVFRSHSPIGGVVISPGHVISNGGANVVSGGPNFFVSFGPGNESATSGEEIWVFYDDAGQAGDNHDDLVIRISTVPLPAGVLLMLTGLGALGLRRKFA